MKENKLKKNNKGMKSVINEMPNENVLNFHESSDSENEKEKLNYKRK